MYELQISFGYFVFGASSVTERVKIENPKALNLALQNANLLVREKITLLECVMWFYVQPTRLQFIT